jgi:DNA-binding CsgD family transcriptional regulator
MTLNFGQTQAPLWELDANGRVIWQNPAASAYVISENAQAFLAHGMFRMRDASADSRLREAIAKLINLDFGYLSRHRSAPIVVDAEGSGPVSVWWAVVEHGRLTVSFNDTPQLLARVDTASTAFGLSAAQHRIVAALVEGLTLSEAADRERIELSTARTQLQRIFDKVGERTQPALVRALLAVTERN